MANHDIGWMERVSQRATTWTGSTQAFMLAVLIILVWGASGPAFRYSDTWQLVINTGTTIVTFLMVFLIQRAQNKEAVAVQVKLDELIRAVKGAHNNMIAIEDLSEAELGALKERFEKLGRRAGELQRQKSRQP
jgi:low affinity Fe/Cu permease